jgi:hypothetical protein
MKRPFTPLVPYMPVAMTGIGINPLDGGVTTIWRA